MFFKKNKRNPEDGYLLPKYWRCLACQGRKKAIYATRGQLFDYLIKNKKFRQSLNQTELESIKSYYKYGMHPQGALLERPPDTKHLEDTIGLARDMTGSGFDAVFLCEDHNNQLSKAIKAAAKS